VSTENGEIGNANNQLTDERGSDILIKGIDILEIGWFVKSLSAAVQPCPVR
jgi:hypothetical protein